LIASYSSYKGIYPNATAASMSNMADGSHLTYWASESFGMSETMFVMADLGYSRLVRKIVIAPIPSNRGGWGPTYTNGRTIQISDNGSTWFNVLAISGVSDYVFTTFNVSFTHRFVRIVQPTGTGTWLAVAQFALYEK
jgi:hypothetical protein